LVGFGPWLGENVDFDLSIAGFKHHFVVHTGNNLLVNLDQLAEALVAVLFSKMLAGGFLGPDKALISSEGTELILMNFAESTNHLK
jgi:hypothetical protein